MSERRDVVVLGSTGSIGTQAHRHRPAQPGPVPGGRARRRRRQRRAARRAGARARRRGRSRWPGPAPRRTCSSRSTPRRKRRGYAAGELPRAQDPGRAGRRRPSWPQWPCDVVLNGITGSLGLGADAGRARRRPHPRAGQQGVAGRRRPAGQGGAAAAGPDRAGRLRALRAGPVPARRHAPARCAGWCSPPAAGRSGAARRDELADVTPEQALAHPTWDMGPVVTINSATLVNKGLEVIEAHLLFDVPLRPASTSWCTRSRSSTRWSSSSTARRSPRPARRTCGCRSRSASAGRTGCPDAAARLRLDRGRAPGSSSRWTTRRSRRSPGAGRPGEAGGTAPAVYNAANEECVAAFLAGRLPFLGIVDTVARVLDDAPRSANQVPSRTCSTPRRGPGRGRAELIAAASEGSLHDLRARGRASSPLGILVSVCLHEAGHLLTAKGFGMKVTQYFVGFGPTLWSFRRGETEYGVKAIPAGGFVQDRRDDAAGGRRRAGGRATRAFWRYPVWQRTVVLVAGSVDPLRRSRSSSSGSPRSPTGLPNPAARRFDADRPRSRSSARSPTAWSRSTTSTRTSPARLPRRRPGRAGQGRRPAARRPDHRRRRHAGHDVRRPGRRRSAPRRPGPVAARPTSATATTSTATVDLVADPAAAARRHRRPARSTTVSRDRRLGRYPTRDPALRAGRRPRRPRSTSLGADRRPDRSRRSAHFPSKIPNLVDAHQRRRARPGDADQRGRRQPDRRRGGRSSARRIDLPDAARRR